MQGKKTRLSEAYEYLRSIGKVHTQNDVAFAMSANKTNVSYAFNGNEKYLTGSFLKRFNKAFGDIFFTDWLLSGDGEMLKSSNYPIKDNGSNIVREANGPYGTLIGHTREATREPGEIPLIPYEIVEKVGLDNYLAAIERGYEKYVVPEFTNADFLTRMSGNTMYPKYSSGDVIACKYLPLDTFYQWNKIYAFNTTQGLLIKRVHEGRDESHLMLSSDNERYPAFQISKNHITAQALVLGSIRLD